MYKAIMIGGSAGSFQIVNKLLSSLPENFHLPIFLCLHRLKHVRKGFVEALSIKAIIPVVEPTDKELIMPGKAYLAPANYHMYIDKTRILLSTEEPVHHSRPSIDLSFYTAAASYKEELIGVILSGANHDGANGLERVSELKGLTIVQEPKNAEVSVMPEACLQLFHPDHVFNQDELINFICKLK